ASALLFKGGPARRRTQALSNASSIIRIISGLNAPSAGPLRFIISASVADSHWAFKREARLYKIAHLVISYLHLGTKCIRTHLPLGRLRQRSVAMLTAKEYRQQAQECLELAKRTEQLYVKEAMTELAEEFNGAAEKLERD